MSDQSGDSHGVFDQVGNLSVPGPESRLAPLPVMSQIQIEPSVVEKVSHLESGEKLGDTVFR